MLFGQNSRTWADARGHMTRHMLGLDFQVGPDSILIRLFQMAQARSFGGLLSVDSLLVDDLMAAGALGYTHVVDVSADDPRGFFFAVYGQDLRFALDTDMSGRHLVTADWSALRRFGLDEYQRLKVSGRPELSQVDVLAGDRISINRRLVLPLTGDRGQVSHLMVSVIRNHPRVLSNTLQ